MEKTHLVKKKLIINFISKVQNSTMNAEADMYEILQEINAHENKTAILTSLKKGPPANKGFMWSMNDTDYWTENELTALKDISEIVLNKGWESSGYGIMMRKIQHHIKTI